MKAKKTVVGKQAARSSELRYTKGDGKTGYVAKPNSGYKTKSCESSPVKKSARIESRLKAARAVLGMWADKDTSFFDKR